jgi:hypothetical protein
LVIVKKDKDTPIKALTISKILNKKIKYLAIELELLKKECLLKTIKKCFATKEYPPPHGFLTTLLDVYGREVELSLCKEVAIGYTKKR